MTAQKRKKGVSSTRRLSAGTGNRAEPVEKIIDYSAGACAAANGARFTRAKDSSRIEATRIALAGPMRDAWQ